MLTPLYGLSQTSIDTCRLEGKLFIKKDMNGEYLYHIDWKPCSYLAIINMNQTSITLIRNSEKSIYTIQSYNKPVQDEKQNLILKFICKDDHDIKCGVVLITLADPIDDYQNMIKIEYNNITLVYRYKD